MKLSKLCRALLVVLGCAVLLCSCGAHKLTVNDNDTYTDRKTGVTYRPLSPCYEPANLGETYASFKISGLKTMLHTVGALPPENYLGSTYYGVYVNENLQIPTFEEMNINRALIYSTDGSVIPTLTLDAEDENEVALLQELTDAYLHGVQVSYPSYQTRASSYTVRFAASNLPELYYCMTYIEYAEDIYDEIDGVETNLGRYFLYDRYNKICVAIDVSLHNALRTQ
jgi:hypothetical protein